MERSLYITVILLAAWLLSSNSGKSREPGPLQKTGVGIIQISQEVKSTVEEHERQKKMNNKQNGNTTTELANKEQWKKLKETATKIQDRLRIVDFALQAIPTGYVIGLKAKEIKDNQYKILQEINSSSQILKEVLPKQVKFVDDLQMVSRFLAGIVLSYGSINQMERAERQILLNFARQEVEKLSNDSFYTLMLIQDIKAQERNRRSMYQYYIQRDKDLVEDLMKNIKRIKL